jgi:hypothetical protein
MVLACERRTSMRILLPASCLVVPLVAVAADQAILGTSIVLTSRPTDGVTRRLTARGRTPAATSTISGDPTTPANSAAAMLHIAVDGRVPSAQTFVLPPGTRSDGKPFWRSVKPEGFEYADPARERGPVRRVQVRRDKRGRVSVLVRIRGRDGAVALAPPDPGTQAFVTLTLGDGDRYCLRFGPEGVVRNRDGRSFGVRRITTEGCPSLVTGEFLALSYNVAGLPQGISGSDPEINMPLIAPLLNGYDLVVLQESWKTPDPNSLAPLRVYHEILEAGSLHPFKSISAPLPFGMDPRRPEAIVSDGLNRFSRFPFGTLEKVAWETCYPSAADCLALKGFDMARTTFAPGVTVDVYDLHMEAGNEPEDDVVRDLGITQLSTFLQAVSAGRPVIVGGDFNLHTDAEPDATQFQRLLTETGLQDVCTTLGCPEPGRIDKFLFRSSDAVTLVPLSWRFETDVFERADGEPLSDHDALAVRFGWTVSGQ